MRVEMRRFCRLYLLFSLLSLAGAACQSRALLQVELMPDPSLRGHPDVEITGLDDASIRSIGVDAGTVGIEQVFVDNGQVLSVGVYFPANFEGTVKVHASVVDDDGCKLGDSDTTSKDVHPGETSYVMVHVAQIDNHCMPPKPDGGGGSGGDAGVDRSGDDGAQDRGADTADERPSSDGGADLSVVADAGEEHATGADAADDAEEHVCDDAAPATPDLRGAPSCDNYCLYVTMNCKGANTQYPAGDCLSVCAARNWRPGMEMVGNGNTIGCRTAFAKAAIPGTDSMTLSMLCAGAGDNSTMCKDASDGGQRE
jgi:hypothetical protein